MAGTLAALRGMRPLCETRSDADRLTIRRRAQQASRIPIGWEVVCAHVPLTSRSTRQRT
jgi:hypothetical protein